MTSEGEAIQNFQRSLAKAGWMKATNFEINLIKNKHLKHNKMTKEEFEKKFKVGDEITWGACFNNWELKYIGDTFIVIKRRKDEEDSIRNISDYDWQKVEPVKKYWKHVYKLSSTSIVVKTDIRERQETVLNAIYLKEPTEITLEDI